MNEKELLTLAARAAGLQGLTYFDEGAAGGKGMRAQELDWENWNPLESNEDAFALAVTLRIDLEFGAQDVAALAWPEQGHIGTILAHYNGEPLAATRRAITQAAAEIGKAMS